MANRFWVGGTATWDGTAGSKWATTSGGAGGAAVPTAADDVFFDANSGANTITTSGTTTDVCRSLNCTGFTGTLSHAAATTIVIGDATAGASNVALLLSTGMTYTKGSTTTSAFSFVSTSSTVQSITLNSKVLGNVTFNGAGGKWQCADNYTATAATVTLTAGQLDFNGKTISINKFSSNNSNTRALLMGASSVTCALQGTAWDITTSTGMTLTPGTSTIALTGNGSTFSGGGLTYATVTISGVSNSTHAIKGSNTFGTLTITLGAAQYNRLKIFANQTVTGTLTMTGNSTVNRPLICSDTYGTARTLTAATVSLSTVDLQDITGAGAATWSGTSLGDCLGNSGITFTTPVTRYWMAVSGGSWSATSSWAASTGGSTGATVPLPQDTVIFDANSITSASRTITGDMARLGASINFTGMLNSPTVSLSGVGIADDNFGDTYASVFGSVTLIAGMTLTASAAALSFENRSAANFDPSTATISTNALVFIQGTGTVSLLNNITLSGSFGTFMVYRGGLTTNNHNITTGQFFDAYSEATLTLGTSTISSGVSIFLDFGGTNQNNLSAASATAVITGTGGQYSAGSGQTVGTVSLQATTALSSSGAGTNITTLNLTAAKTYTLSNGPFNVTNFNATGTAGNIITITSASAVTLSKTSGVVSCDYLSLTNSAASGGATWYAGANSTNVSGNTGWIFTAPPLTKTQSAVARIVAQLTKTQSAIARVANNKTKTQTATAHISPALVKNQTAKASIIGVATKTQSATARIDMPEIKIQTAISRIANIITKTQAALSRIANVKTKTQPAIARVSKTLTKTQPAKAAIQQTVTHTQTATARIVFPPKVQKGYYYKVYRNGQFLGLLPNVASEFGFSQDINSAGAQISVKVAVSADTSFLPLVQSIQDESGNDLQDESGNPLLTEGAVDIVGFGADTTLIRNGNKVQVWEYSNWHPNGVCVFLGEIEHWEASFGGDGEDDCIDMLIYSDGQDLSNHMLIGSSYVPDQIQNVGTSTYSLTTGGGKFTGFYSVGQQFTVGSGVTNIGAIGVFFGGVSTIDEFITLYLWPDVASANAGTGLIASATVEVHGSGGTPLEQIFGFSTPVPTTAGSTYFFTVVNGVDSIIPIYYNNSNIYSGGSMYVAANGGANTGTYFVTPYDTVSALADLRFKTYSNAGETVAVFTSKDPSTDMLVEVIGNYNTQGGVVQTTGGSIDATTLSLTYEFNTSTVLNGINTFLSLSPDGFYWYVDLGTDVLYFKNASTSPDIVLTKGVEIDKLKVVASIENIKNIDYFSGGLVSGSNLFSVYQDSTSITEFGQRLNLASDNRVTLQATADAIGNAFIAENKDEQFQTSVTLLDSQIDITSLRVGMIVGFRGYGVFVDTLATQIVHIDYTPEEITLTLGTLPPRTSISLAQINRDLIAQQTIANPTSPS